MLHSLLLPLRFLGHVSPYTETPVVACVVSGSLAALLSLLVSLRDLIEMMSIGTLLAYTLVSVCVLLLRYQPEANLQGHSGGYLSGEEDDGGKMRKEGVLAECEKEAYQGGQDYHDGTGNTCDTKNPPDKGDDEMLIDGSDPSGYQSDSSGYGLSEKSLEGEEAGSAPSTLLKKLLGPRYYTLRVRLGLPDSSDRPTPATGRTVTRCVLLLFVLTFLLWSIVIYGLDEESGARWALVPLVGIIIFKMVALLVIILRQPESPKKLPYMAPCVPFVPVAAMLVNIYLMLKLSRITWVRFAVWCSLGTQLSYSDPIIEQLH